MSSSISSLALLKLLNIFTTERYIMEICTQSDQHPLPPTRASLIFIKGNVLVSPEGQALLSDFGLVAVGNTSQSALPTTSNFSGAMQWLAPGLVDAEGSPVHKSAAGDVFAFGRLCLVVRTNNKTLVNATQNCAYRYAQRSNRSRTKNVLRLSSMFETVLSRLVLF
jgi:hypothetical protein